jgi:hypothetical protein
MHENINQGAESQRPLAAFSNVGYTDRHVRQYELDIMLKRTYSRQAQKDIKTRQHLMERSFARGTRYGFKRAIMRSVRLLFASILVEAKP